MRFQLSLLIALFVAFGVAISTQKPVIVSYPHDTPIAIIDEAKDAIRQAGGIITHEYNLIKGFAAKVSDEVLDTIQAMGMRSGVRIEEDQVLSVN